jgi:Fungal specific transcription factor domain
LDDFGLSQAEIEQRRNVFWILYFLDKSASLRIGQPSVITDDDIAVDLPQEKETSHVYPDGSKKYSIFRFHVEIGLIESRISRELYSIRAMNKSELERLKSVGRLDKELTEWRDRLPREIRPEEPINCRRDQFIPVIMMHFTYLNALTTIHRASVNHGSWINVRSKQDGSGFLNQHLNPRVFSSHSICLSAARSSIELLETVGNYSPRNNLIWYVASFGP